MLCSLDSTLTNRNFPVADREMPRLNFGSGSVKRSSSIDASVPW